MYNTQKPKKNKFLIDYHWDCWLYQQNLQNFLNKIE